MTALTEMYNALFGNPPSSDYKPSRSGVYAAFDQMYSQIQAIQSSQSVGSIIFSTKAQMDAELDYDENTKAEVWEDGTPANNGVYRKLGASGAGSWDKVGDLGIVDLDARVDDLETLDIEDRLILLEKCGVTICTNAVGDNGAVYVQSPINGETITAYVNGKLYLIMPTASNSVTLPPLTIGGGPAKVLANGDANPLRKFSIRPSWPLLVQYSSASGGFFKAIAPLFNRDFVPLVVTGGTANEVTASPVDGVPIYGHDQAIMFSLRLTADVTASLLKINISGLGLLECYDDLASGYPRELLREGTTIFFRYSANFSGIICITSPRPHINHAADANRAVILGDESSGAGIRMLYREINPAPSFNPVLAYDNQFTSAGNATGFTTLHGIGPSDAFSQDAVGWSASSGGYIEMTATATGSGAWWWDHNHVDPGPGFLQILLGVGGPLTSGPLPAIADLRNYRVEFVLDAVDLVLAGESRLVFHLQANDTAVIDGGTGKPINYCWYQPLDVALGSDGAGFGRPPILQKTLNGEATFIIDLIPNPAFWLGYGTSYGRADTYAHAPIDRVLENGELLNFQIQMLHPQTFAGKSRAATPPVDKSYGGLRMKSFIMREPV